METRHYWEENGHAVKFENYNSAEDFGRTSGEQLNFAAASEDEAEYPPGSYLKKGKVSRQDPMSHRIIEKRRRDRMNNCLADLSRLIPPEYLKKGRGRVEKTEIIEMAIRHLKYLQERANGLYHTMEQTTAENAAERQASEEHFRAGFQEAVAEAVRFLVEVQGYGRGDGLCLQLAAHLQRHCEHITKGERLSRNKPRSQPGSSSETASSSSSSHGYHSGVIAQARRPEPPTETPAFVQPAPEPYESDRPLDQTYPMDCDRGELSASGDGEAPAVPLPLENRRREPTLRAVRKPEHTDDFLHSYKFKNSIERRFSRSQDCEATDMSMRSNHMHSHGKVLHKRRRAAKPVSSSTSASGSTEDARDTSPQDTSSESPQHQHYDKPALPPQYVPVFALNSLGKYYVPLSVEYSCLSRQAGAFSALDGRAAHMPAPLHPVTIHVNFQPCLDYHLKRDPDADWRRPTS